MRRPLLFPWSREPERVCSRVTLVPTPTRAPTAVQASTLRGLPTLCVHVSVLAPTPWPQGLTSEDQAPSLGLPGGWWGTPVVQAPGCPPRPRTDGAQEAALARGEEMSEGTALLGKWMVQPDKLQCFPITAVSL